MKLVAQKRQTLHPITKKHPSRLPAYGATSPDVFLSCGKQDLKSETAVNSVQLCIIRFDFETNLHNYSK